MTAQAMDRSLSILIAVYIVAIISAWLPFPGPAWSSNWPDSAKSYTSNSPVRLMATGVVPCLSIRNLTECNAHDAGSHTGPQF